MQREIPPQTDVWVTEWMYVPAAYRAPIRGMGQHISRLYDLDHEMQFENLKIENNTAGFTYALYGGPTRADRERGIRGLSLNSIQRDQWHCVETHMKFNTPGKVNGVFEFWMDGVRYANDLSINYRASVTGNIGWNAVQVVSNTTPDAHGWPAGNMIYVEDFMITVGRRGCQ